MFLISVKKKKMGQSEKKWGLMDVQRSSFWIMDYIVNYSSYQW
jgi:hypothetical protein